MKALWPTQGACQQQHERIDNEGKEAKCKDIERASKEINHWFDQRIDQAENNGDQLSGGEQMSAALALRLALLREMSNIDIAFFDEPTTNLDETRRDSLARQILDVRGFRQLFVISHDDTFEQVTQNLIRVNRLDGISSVVQS